MREISRAEVERRLRLLNELLEECKAKQFGVGEKGIDILDARKLDMLRVLRRAGAMRAAEFDRQFGLRNTIRSPLFHLLLWQVRDEEKWLVFDERRFAEYAEQDFEAFLDWDRLLLRALAAQA